MAWNDRQLPYPVLSPYADNYGAFAFGLAECNPAFSDGNLNLVFSYRLTCPSMLALIEKGQAEYHAVLHSGGTGFRRHIHHSGGDRRAVDIIAVGDLDGQRAELTPYVVTGAEAVDYNPPELNEEYRLVHPWGFRVPPYSILAVGAPQIIDLSDAGVDSVIDLIEEDDVKDGYVALDLDAEHVRILVSPSDRRRLNRLRKEYSDALQSPLSAGLMLPVIACALAQLPDHTERAWGQSFAQAVDAELASQGQQWDDYEQLKNPQTAWEYAQRMLKGPLTPLLDSLLIAEDNPNDA